MNRTKSIEKFAQSSHIYTKAAMFIHDPAIVRILIVEDDPIMQLGLTQALEDYPIFSIVRTG